MVSNCCGANIIENTDLCSKCKEHCEVLYTSEDLEGLSFEEQVVIMESAK